MRPAPCSLPPAARNWCDFADHDRTEFLRTCASASRATTRARGPSARSRSTWSTFGWPAVVSQAGPKCTRKYSRMHLPPDLSCVAVLISPRHLKPGSGWIEHVEVDLEPRCDDGTLAPDSHLTQWYNYLRDATARVDRPIAYDHRTRQLLQAAGFIDIQETIIRAPYNSWPADPHQKDIGRWYNLALTEGLEALSAAPFTRVNRWNMNEHVKPLVEHVRREVCNRKIHAYNNM